MTIKIDNQEPNIFSLVEGIDVRDAGRSAEVILGTKVDGQLATVTIRLSYAQAETLAAWKPVSDEDATPRGMTPLNDATGKIVALANAGNYDKVAIIIMTDGQENSSRELTVAQAKKLPDDCRAKNWQVIFLGANFDNASQAGSYGNAAASTVRSSAKNLGATMTETALRASYAATGAAMNFTDEQKKRLATVT